MSFKQRFRPSYWEKQTFLAPYDVAIVGGGIVGLNAAMALKARHAYLRIIVVERGVYPIGASTRNAGFACFGSISEVLADMDTLGYNATLELFVKRKRGLDKLFRVVDRDIVDYRHFGGNEIFLQGEEKRYEACLGEIDRLNRDLSTEFGDEVFVPDDASIRTLGLRNVKHLIAHPMEGQLHPGKLVMALMQRASELGVLFANGFQIDEIREEDQFCKLISQNLEIEARHVIVASNGFAADLIDNLEVTPARNQVMVTKPVQGLKLKGCFHYNEGYVYFRNIDGRVLIGGARHVAQEEEQTSDFGLTSKVTDWLKAFMDIHLGISGDHVEYAWSGIMGVGPVKHPVVRMVSARIGVAVRLGGMGVAIGSLVGADAADLIEQQL